MGAAGSLCLTAACVHTCARDDAGSNSQDSELLERQPTLREQLSALTPQQMETRLQSAFAITPRRPAPFRAAPFRA